MNELRDTLERIVAPPSSPDFHERLSDRIQAAERTAARRWRAAAIVATAAALAAATAAGVLAFGSSAAETFDRTLSCAVPEHGGVNLLYLFARVKGEPPTRMYFWKLPNPATLEVDAARQLYLVRNTQHVLATTYAGASPTMKNGYTFDDSDCRATRQIPLARAGLPTFGVFNGKHGAYGLAQDCWLAPVATVRMRVTVGSSGRPVAARLALRSGSRLRPVAYIEWTPTLVRAWISKTFCRPHTGL